MFRGNPLRNHERRNRHENGRRGYPQIMQIFADYGKRFAFFIRRSQCRLASISVVSCSFPGEVFVFFSSLSKIFVPLEETKRLHCRYAQIKTDGVNWPIRAYLRHPRLDSFLVSAAGRAALSAVVPSDIWSARGAAPSEVVFDSVAVPRLPVPSKNHAGILFLWSSYCAALDSGCVHPTLLRRRNS